jgi:NADPH:quinone reductase-like Zn-dependent oxidoreductase
MSAVVQRAYGEPEDALEYVENFPVPGFDAAAGAVKLGDDEVLLRVRATSVHADVWHVCAGFPKIVRWGTAAARFVGAMEKQDVPGTDVAGVVVAVGNKGGAEDSDSGSDKSEEPMSSQSPLRVGDRAFGEVVGGFQWKNGGTFAQFCKTRVNSLSRIPEGVSFEEAAVTPTQFLITSWNIKGLVSEGDRVLVNGGAGALGQSIIQVAKAFGASHVTGVDSTERLDLLRAFGCDDVIDYTDETTPVLVEGTRYDLIVDVASVLNVEEAASDKHLTDKGKYVWIGHDNFGHGATGAWFGSVPRAIGLTRQASSNKHLVGDRKEEDIREDMVEMLARGQIKPVIDPQPFALKDAAAALRYVMENKTHGKVVLRID